MMKNLIIIAVLVLSNAMSYAQQYLTNYTATPIAGNKTEVSVKIKTNGGSITLGASNIAFNVPAGLTYVDIPSVTTKTTLPVNYSILAPGTNLGGTIYATGIDLAFATSPEIIGSLTFREIVKVIFEGQVSNPIFTTDEAMSEIYNTTSGSNAPFGGNIVLPTDLLSFKGIKKGAVSQLQWEATNEKNLINYIVERSADGRNFHPIGFNKPKAVSSLEKATYDFIDDQPEIGLNYYRLLSKGFGKDEKYSKVISLDFGIGLSGRAFPNPLDGDLTIELDIENGSGEVVVGIYDIAGRQVVSKKIQNSDRRLNIPLPTADLPPGSYLVRVKAGVFSWERQITKM
jgi:hypothetical protein